MVAETLVHHCRKASRGKVFAGDALLGMPVLTGPFPSVLVPNKWAHHTPLEQH